MSENTPYARLGVAAIRAVVDTFYDAVLADEELAPWFTHLDDERRGRLRRHQTALLTQVLGGPSSYPDVAASLRDAHAALDPPVTDEAYDRVCLHLVAALREHAVPDDIVTQVVATADAVRPLIVAATPGGDVDDVEEGDDADDGVSLPDAEVAAVLADAVPAALGEVSNDACRVVAAAVSAVGDDDWHTFAWVLACNLRAAGLALVREAGR